MPRRIDILCTEDLRAHSTVSENGCWIWNHSVRGQSGYAQVTDRVTTRAVRQMGGHVLAYFFKAGELPPRDLVVMHSCDTPRCVNPDHVSLGTHHDNIEESFEKGRRVEHMKGNRQRMKEDKTGIYAQGRQIGMPRGLKKMNGEIPEWMK